MLGSLLPLKEIFKQTCINLGIVGLVLLTMQDAYATSHTPDDLASQVDRMMQDYDDNNVPGASVGIFEGSRIRLYKNYGLRDLENDEPVTSETNFRTASLTKAFTATAIMQMVEAKRIDLNDTLTDLFDDFPSYGSKITVHHLLSHSSGLLDYENFVKKMVLNQVTDSDVVELMKQQRSTYFSPGSRFRYSNTGYAVLAEIVRKRSQTSFHNYLKEQIFSTLGMHETVALVQGENSVNLRAYGYSMVGSSYKRDDQSRTSAVLGDGGIYSSTSDLFNWYRMWIYGSPVLTPESQKLMTTAKQLNNGTKTKYGYGWVVDTFEGHDRISHTGSTVGQRHAIAIFPKKQIGIIILTNRQNSAPWLIVDKIADIILDENEPILHH